VGAKSHGMYNARRQKTVLVTLRCETSIQAHPRRTQARIRYKNLTGDRYLDLNGATGTRPAGPMAR